MGNITFSIIMPVYNSEKYLPTCLDSIFNQTFKGQFEVIAVRNFYTDNSLKILKDYQKKYPNLNIIELNENVGAANARMLGIKASKGDYLAFIDSDDYYHREFLETIYKEIQKGYDIVSCSYFEDRQGKTKKFMFSKTATYDAVKATKAMLLDFSVRGFMWNKVFKRSLFTDKPVPYPKTPGTLFEDVVTIFYTLSNVKSFRLISTPLYYYRLNDTSVTQVVNKKRFNEHLYAFAFIRYICDQKEDKRFTRNFRSTFLRSYLSLWYDASLLKNEFGHSPLKHMKLFKRELSLLKSKKPLPIKGEVWESYFKDCDIII